MTHRRRAVLLVVAFASLVPLHAGTAFAGPDVPIAHAQKSDVARERTSVVRFARRFLGTPYVYGGGSPSGFDCSGFTRYVYAHFGYDLPHYSGGQFAAGHAVDRGGLAPGDLVFFDSFGHVGIYVGDDEFIHAPHTGRDVAIDSLSGWYGSRFVGARRLL